MPRSVCVILGRRPFGRTRESFSKQESCSSLRSSATAVTELSSSLHDLSEYTSSFCDSQYKKSVTFNVDEYDDIREEMYEYEIEEGVDKSELYWSTEEVAARTNDRTTMVDEECPERARFIACVEELFNIPIRKRIGKQSILSGSDERNKEQFMSIVTEEEAVQGVSSSIYRGYEHRCVRAIVSLRRRSIRQILTAHWVRGGHQVHEVAVKLSHRQARFAHLVALGDAKLAAEYLGRVPSQ